MSTLAPCLQVIRTIRGYIASHGGGRYADASPFFKTIHWAKWQRQVGLCE